MDSPRAEKSALVIRRLIGLNSSNGLIVCSLMSNEDGLMTRRRMFMLQIVGQGLPGTTGSSSATTRFGVCRNGIEKFTQSKVDVDQQIGNAHQFPLFDGFFQSGCTT